jgi:hypothetical protein
VANSNYNGLIATVRTTTWHRLTSQFSYTMGRARDEESAVRGINPTNSYDLHRDYGNADFDVRHTFTSYLVYEIPSPAHARLLLGGWQLNSLLAFHSGQPFTVRAGKNYSGTFEGRDMVNVVGDPFQGVNHSLTNGFVQWLNPAAFAVPPAGTFGTEARNQFYGPGFADVDLSAFKNTRIGERISTQLRVEMFNIFNRHNYPNPNTTFSSGSFGRITDTVGDSNGATGIGAGEPFNVQLALKVIF